MRLLFTWRDHLRTLTVKTMAAFASAVVAQFEVVIETANTWAAVDHSTDGTHTVIHLNTQGAQPAPVIGSLTLYYDGGDLKVVFPNGTTGTVTIT